MSSTALCRRVVIKLLDIRVQSLILDCVNPETKGGADTMHEGKPGQDLVLIDNHISELVDDVELEEGIDGVDHVMDPHCLAAGAEVGNSCIMAVVSCQPPEERTLCQNLFTA